MTKTRLKIASILMLTALLSSVAVVSPAHAVNYVSCPDDVNQIVNMVQSGTTAAEWRSLKEGTNTIWVLNAAQPRTIRVPQNTDFEHRQGVKANPGETITTRAGTLRCTGTTTPGPGPGPQPGPTLPDHGVGPTDTIIIWCPETPQETAEAFSAGATAQFWELLTDEPGGRAWTYNRNLQLGAPTLIFTVPENWTVDFLGGMGVRHPTRVRGFQFTVRCAVES